jgi:hypothetical protein
MSLHRKHDPVTTWLKNLQRALAPLPGDDSREILAEAREHIAERVATGVPPLKVLSAFGNAETYVQGFVDEYLLDRARSSRRTLPMLRTVVRFAGRSVIAGLGLVCVVISGFFGLWSLGCIAVKIVRPDLVGLWLDLPLSAQHRYEHSQRDFIPLSFGHDHIVFGFQNPPPSFPEYLGAWIYPCMAGIALVSYIALRASLLLSVNRIRLPNKIQPNVKTSPEA